tara:strand:+ start:791 stop:1012 length:222 start_codon:yes stop_codon:yes gene_type:complete
MDELGDKELKPCPFCGSTELYVGPNTTTSYHVMCCSCFGKGTSYTIPFDPTAQQVDWEKRCKILAIEAWNKRV